MTFLIIIIKYIHTNCTIFTLMIIFNKNTNYKIIKRYKLNPSFFICILNCSDALMYLI